MKDGEKADLGAQVLRIERDRTKGLGCRVEQDVVDLSFVLIGDDGDFGGDRADHVEILRGSSSSAWRSSTHWARAND